MKRLLTHPLIAVVAIATVIVHRSGAGPKGTVVMAGTEVPDYSFLADIEMRHMALRTPISWARAAWRAVDRLIGANVCHDRQADALATPPRWDVDAGAPHGIDSTPTERSSLSTTRQLAS